MNDPEIRVIKARSGWQIIDWKELREYKDLFYFLTLRDIKIQYKQTVFGFLWAIIQPLVLMVIFTFVLGKLAKAPTDELPSAIFHYTVLPAWTYFSNALNQSGQSLVASANMITKVYFPRLIVPMAPVLAKLIDMVIAYVILIPFMFYYEIVPSASILMFPVLILLLIITAAGAGMWLTALAVKYRDVKYIIGFTLQALMWITPVTVPVSTIQDKFGETWRLVYGIYPMGGIIESIRASLVGAAIPWDLLGISAATSIIMFVTGMYYFKRTERVFADVA
ncbi:MAG: phosphate ABC transporter permease [Ectothiorhodospiraceae bacterium]|nr:phosphate ABC transporter permease [Ectothiorhodospiraceae bacterium]